MQSNIEMPFFALIIGSGVGGKEELRWVFVDWGPSIGTGEDPRVGRL